METQKKIGHGNSNKGHTANRLFSRGVPKRSSYKPASLDPNKKARKEKRSEEHQEKLAKALPRIHHLMTKEQYWDLDEAVHATHREQHIDGRTLSENGLKDEYIMEG